MIVARGDGPHLRDPNWYRVRYALAVQYLEIATAVDPEPAGRVRKVAARYRRRRRDESQGAEAGWPVGIDSRDGRWRDAYGEETAEILADLHENKAPSEDQFRLPASEAKIEASELLAAAAGILEEAGWHWVGRKPPRFVRWKRAISPARITRRRPVIDRELVRFLSWIVEPATVVLFFSAWLTEEESEPAADEPEPPPFPMAELKEAIGPRSPESFESLDRRIRVVEGDSWLIDYLARLVYDWPPKTLSARAQARLGRTQLRRPRKTSFRVQYNLACLFSRLTGVAAANVDPRGEREFASIASVQLEKALFHLPDEQRGRLVKWAKVDPGLAVLRKRRKNEFEETIARWGAGDTREVGLDGFRNVQRVKYDPGSEILDIYFLDGSRLQYGGVPVSVVDNLEGTISRNAPGPDERNTIEKTFLESVEREYLPIRP